MKIVVLGASGGCGQQLVQQAVAAGHDVTAVVRSKSWQAPSPKVRVVAGDVTSVAFLKEALAGQEAVLCALGLRLKSLAPWEKPEVADLLTRTGPALVEAMKACGVKRVLAVSAGGVGDSRTMIPGFFRVMMGLTALRHAYAELEVFERTLLSCGLEVSICRPTGLTDGERTGQVKVVTAMKGRATISRADVAGWMLGEVVKPSLEHRTPVITVTGA
jgi:putative NADH-flavin reductase